MAAASPALSPWFLSVDTMGYSIGIQAPMIRTLKKGSWMESHSLSIPPLSPLLIPCYVVGKKGAQTVEVNLCLSYCKLKAGYVVRLRSITLCIRVTSKSSLKINCRFRLFHRSYLEEDIATKFIWLICWIAVRKLDVRWSCSTSFSKADFHCLLYFLSITS